MYLLIPDIFFIPVRYDEENILNLKKIELLQEFNSFNGFINKITKRQELVIGVSLPDEIGERWAKERRVMEQYAKNRGVTVKIENANFDAIKQASQVENLISQGVDVLILDPVDSSNAEEFIEKAHKLGIKVISYDRLIQNSDPDLYVSFNNIRVGQLQGQFITREVPVGNYIIMSGDIKDYNSKLFKEGAMEYIQPIVFRGNIKIVTDEAVKDWDARNAYKIVKDSLIANKNKVDAILAPNDATAGAAIEALKEQDLAGKVAVIGQDADSNAIRRIIDRTQSMTVFKDVREEAKISIDAAIKLAKGHDIEINAKVNNGKIDVPSILLEPLAIDKNNAKSVLINGGYLTEKDVY